MGFPWMYRMRARVVTKKWPFFIISTVVAIQEKSCASAGLESHKKDHELRRKGKGQLKVGILKECKTTQKKGWVLWNGKELDQKIVIYSSLKVI